MRRHVVAYGIVLAFAVLAACGGGGGGGGGDGGTSSAGRTTFTGNLAETTGTVGADVGDVQVCIEGTTFCTAVADDGTFTLAGDVGGDVTLVFTAPEFVARVALTDVPRGATIRLTNIRCNTITGFCEPDDVDIIDAETHAPIRCEQGAVRIAHAGRELVIDGGGGDCIRTAGQCDVAIEADRIVLQGCATCIRAAGGSDVTITAGPGGITCTASEDGIRAEGNAAVHVAVAPDGDLDVSAGEVGIRSSGTASVDVAGDVCRIDGGENALRIDGNADVDTGGCTTVDLVGGIGHEGGDDDDRDDDHGHDD